MKAKDNVQNQSIALDKSMRERQYTPTNRRFIVRGVVVHGSDGVNDVVVKAYHQSLRQEHLLGETVTDLAACGRSGVKVVRTKLFTMLRRLQMSWLLPSIWCGQIKY